MRFLGFAAALVAAPLLAGVDCADWLFQRGYFPQEAAVYVLRNATDHRESAEIVRVYADTLDQDDTPDERQAAEAAAIRLAIAIQKEGGCTNPFHHRVHDNVEQSLRLESHPCGLELIDLWVRAGWMPRDRRGRLTQKFLVWNGLPRILFYDGSVRARHEESPHRLAERMPSVTRFEASRPAESIEERAHGRRWTAWSLAARGHLGAGTRIPHLLDSLPDWYFNQFNRLDTMQPHPEFLATLSRAIDESPQKEPYLPILRAMRGDPPELADFVGPHSLIVQAEEALGVHDLAWIEELRYLPQYLRQVVVPRLERYLERQPDNGQRRVRVHEILEDLVLRPSQRLLREAIFDVATSTVLRGFGVAPEPGR